MLVFTTDMSVYSTLNPIKARRIKYEFASAFASSRVEPLNILVCVCLCFDFLDKVFYIPFAGRFSYGPRVLFFILDRIHRGRGLLCRVCFVYLHI